MSELVKALEAIDHMSVEDCFLQSPLFAKAASEITRLTEELSASQARVKVLESALKPFADAANEAPPEHGDENPVDYYDGLHLGDLRQAARALEGSHG